MKHIIPLILLFSLSCSDTSDSQNDNICVSFDVRQCQGDPWTDHVDLNVDANNQSQQYSTYFESVDVQVTDIKIDLSFHEIVCEACFVCPQGPRVYLKIDSSDLSILEGLEPLNLERFDCSLF